MTTWQLCKLVLEPTRLTGADILAPPLPPTDKADTDDRNTKEHPTPLPSLELQIPH